MPVPSRRTLVWSGNVRAAKPGKATQDETRATPFDRGEARRRIIARYASTTQDGQVLRCESQRDLHNGIPRWRAAGNYRKVVYPSLVAAQAAARELETIGADPQEAYICPMSRSGHVHLARKQ